MTIDQTVVPAFEQVERVDRLLEGGAGLGAPDADETRKLLSVCWALAEPGNLVQVPVDVTGRVLVTFSRMRHHPGGLARQEVEEEAHYLERLLLAALEDGGQLAEMLVAQCRKAAARV